MVEKCEQVLKTLETRLKFEALWLFTSSDWSSSAGCFHCVAAARVLGAAQCAVECIADTPSTRKGRKAHVSPHGVAGKTQ